MFEFANFFPYESVRDPQNTSINFALDAFINKNKKFVILEMGTGCGKSAVGLTIAKYLNQNAKALEGEEYDVSSLKTGKSYFITTQKILQDQYVNDFGRPNNGDMRSIKSSSNYTCTGSPSSNCQETQAYIKASGDSSNICNFNCVYKKERNDFFNSSLSITNFPYFLTSLAYAKTIKKRQVLVVDECHNIEIELGKFVEVNISERYSKTLGVEFPDKETPYQVIKWIKDEYYPKVISHITYIEKILSSNGKLKEKVQENKKLSDQIEKLKSHGTKIENFLKDYSSENWVFTMIPGDKKSLRKFSFKPIDISSYAHQYLFDKAEYVILMSATILNKDAFCEILGIDKNNAEFISIDSPFPIENRPIVFHPVGKMSKEHIDDTLPMLAETVKAILDMHKNEKGIIHAHTYKIAEYLKKNIRQKRLLIHNSENRDEILEYHINSKEPTVLLSPSMSEGVDLSGDKSRFQIICKIPYPYLGDKLTRKRMNKWSWWYPMQTAKIIVQSVGRSIRNEKDSAITYILDSDWQSFLYRNRSIFPESFLKTLK